MQSLPFFIVSLCKLRFRFSICAPAIPGRRLAPMQGDERDETLIDENLVETEIPLADRIPGAVRETEEGDRPIYDEEGHRNDPGGE